MRSCFLDLNCVRTSFRRLAQILAICSAFVAPLAACSNMKTISWREEVRLHTGQIIMVDRTENYRLVSEGLRSGWLFDTETIKAHFPPPVGEITWSGILTPIAIDATSTGQVYLVADKANLAGIKAYPTQDGIPQVAFKYVSADKWQRIAISEIPADFHRNLLSDTYTLFIQDHSDANFVDFALKTKVDSDPRISKDMLDWPRH